MTQGLRAFWPAGVASSFYFAFVLAAPRGRRETDIAVESMMMTRNIKYAFWGLLTLASLLWLVAEPAALRVQTFIELQAVVTQYSGIIAMMAMSVAMILALRPRWPERWLGGMDKIYRLHKWLGITALVVSVFHWLWAEGPEWATELGWMAQPEMETKPVFANGIERALMQLEHPAHGLGQWAFYIAAVLIVLALIKSFPYRRFFKTHRVLAVTYMVLTFHAVILMDFGYWTSPIGVVMAVLMVFGNYAAVVVLRRRVGASRKVRGTVAALQYFPDIRSLEAVVDVGGGWPGHKPGQFAFVTTDADEGPHPYTIASAWNDGERQLTFVIKELGDHTSRLRETLHAGQEVTVEGPYGCFDFEDGRHRQIWVGAGIGITPFMAAMKRLAAERRAHPDRVLPAVDLFHATSAVDETMLANLQRDARAANVRLHMSIDDRDGYLDGERIRAIVGEWSGASLWFCGPEGFGKVLREDFARQGMAVAGHFHQELFAMR